MNLARTSTSGAIRFGHGGGNVIRRKIHGGDTVIIKYLHAASGDGIGERFIEFGAGDLVGVFEAVGELILKIKVAGLVAAHEDGAVLAHEILFLHGFKQASALQQGHADGQHAFADDETGKFLFFHDEHAKFFAVQDKAARVPAGPAPMIRTSVSIGFISLVETKGFLGGFGLQQRGDALDILVERAVVFKFA